MTRRTLLYLGGGLLALALSTGGFFWYQHYQAVMNAEPVKIYKVTQPRQVSETPSLQGEVSVQVQHAETSEAGHWHGDEWHAEPHTEPAPEPKQSEHLSLTKETKEERLRKIEQYPEPLRTWGLEGEALREEGDALYKNRNSLPREEFERQDAEWTAKMNVLYFKLVEYNKQQHGGTQ